MNIQDKTTKAKRTDLTLYKKIELSRVLKRETNLTQRVLALKYNLSLALINKLFNMDADGIQTDDLKELVL